MKILSLYPKRPWQVLALLALCSAPGQALAGADITYPGNGVLASSPFAGMTGLVLLPQGSFSDNRVTINDGAMNYAFGAGDTGSQALGNNTLILNGGAVHFDAFGAYSENGGAAAGNTVIINGGSVRAIYGAQAVGGGSVTGNRVLINGGSASSSIVGGQSFSGMAVGNSVALSGGSVGLTLIGGWGKQASENWISVSGGTVTGDIYGGFGHANSSGIATGMAEANSVSISGGRVSGKVYGGHGGSANGNSVSMSGGSVAGDIYGAYATGSAPVQAANNSVSISGGSVSGHIYGAYADRGLPTHNTVSIADAARLSSQTIIYGSYDGSSGSTSFINTANTLNIRNWRGTVANVHNFDQYNFSLPDGMKPGDTVLTLVGGSQTDLERTSVRHSSYIGSGTLFSAGDSVNLIQNAAGILTNGATLFDGKVQQGVSLVYDYDLNATADTVRMTFAAPQLLPQTQAVAQARVASLGFVNMGADLVAGPGVDNARQAALAGLSSGETDNSWGVAAFAAVNGGRLHYDVGGGTDVRGSSFMLGLAKTWRLAPVDVLVSAFFEAGFSKFDNNGHGANGAGDGRYTGGGMLARVDLTQSLLKGFYVESSFRSGVQHSFYDGHGLTHYAGDSASYRTNSPYFGLHGGLGYVWQMTEQAALDVYGKYFWTRQYGSNVSIAGDPYSFKITNSQRIRTGARFSYALRDWFSPYIGAAYEHEFDGKGKVTAYGLDIPAPSVKGGTGVGEMGVSFRPEAIPGLSIDLGMQGYTGKRSGVTGSLQMKLEF